MGNNGAVHSSSCTYAIFDSGRRGGYQAAAQACQGARHDRAGDHRPRQYVRSQGVSRRGRKGGDQADSRLRGLRGRRQPLRQERQGRPGRPPDSAGQEYGGVPQSFQNRVVCLYRGVLLPSPGRQGAAAPLSRRDYLLLGLSGRRTAAGYHEGRHAGGAPRRRGVRLHFRRGLLPRVAASSERYSAYRRAGVRESEEGERRAVATCRRVRREIYLLERRALHHGRRRAGPRPADLPQYGPRSGRSEPYALYVAGVPQERGGDGRAVPRSSGGSGHDGRDRRKGRGILARA